MAAAAAVIGIGVQAYSMISSANAEADAASKDAAIRGKQAEEVEHTGLSQERDARIQEGQVTSEQTTVFAKGGIDMSGSALLALEDTHYKASKEVTDIRHEWMFKQNQINASAQMSEELGSQRRTAGYINAGGTVLSGAARAYGTYGDKTKAADPWGSGARNSTDSRGFSNA